ncbi:holo-ACP synthase [Streptococcaceae bacterium ESL0687]|nr:holo-ACP synthase [Streptococcaceae bacterium ESL0687]
MIKNIGIDNIELSRIKKAQEKNSNFAKRVLTEAEQVVYNKYSGQRQIEYLAGRWSAKEAFSKAWGTGIGKVSFQDLEILNNEAGAPYFSKSPFNDCGKVFVSISHSNLEAIAFVILEEG